MEIGREQLLKLLTVLVNPFTLQFNALTSAAMQWSQQKGIIALWVCLFVQISFHWSSLSSHASFTGWAVFLSTQEPCEWEGQLVHICLQLSTSMPLLFPQCSNFSNWDKKQSCAITHASAFRSGFPKHVFRSGFHASLHYRDSICIVHFRLIFV